MTRDNIFNLLIDINGDFEPRLSDRINLAEYSDKIINNAEVFSITNNGIIKAFLAIYCNDLQYKTAYITLFYIKKEFRGQNLGEKILGLVIQYIKTIQFEEIRLEVFKSNKKAFKFYISNGFSIYKESETSYFLNLILIS